MSARPFDWSDLEVFLATARGGSLAAAATALGLDSSTVHRRIAKLEAALRTRLFDRSQRGYSLTGAGEDLLAHAHAMDEHVVAAERQVIARDDALAGTVRVATVDDFAITVLSPIIRSFRDAHPNVMVALDISNTFTDLSRHQADVAIRFGIKPPEGDVVAKNVLKAYVALYGSRAYLAKHPRVRRLEDLREHFVVRADEAMSGMPDEQLMNRYCDPSKIAFRSNSFFARLAAIRDGVGLGFLGCYMGDRHKALRRIAIPFPEIAASVSILVHVDIHRNARVRAFVKHVQEELIIQRKLFEG